MSITIRETLTHGTRHVVTETTGEALNLDLVIQAMAKSPYAYGVGDVAETRRFKAEQVLRDLERGQEGNWGWSWFRLV